jgi:5-methylthioribose kinase
MPDALPRILLSVTDLAACALAVQELLPGTAPVISIAKAGEGNMNLTLRARLAAGSTLIVKQSRPWVEKYPQVAAPLDRAITEAAFYKATQSIPKVATAMPALLAASDELRILIFQDLGPSADLTPAYCNPAITADAIASLATYLRALHDGTAGRNLANLRNLEMRELNHAHIFDLPLRSPPLLDLDALAPGLATAATILRADAKLLQVIQTTGQLYLATASDPVLLHGDFFFGSFLSTPAGLRVIDPEFCFPGPRAFDLAVTIAHLALSQHPISLARQLLADYGTPVDLPLLSRFAGIEVIRRLIGLAQLPLPASCPRTKLLAAAHQATICSDFTHLFP